MSVAKFDKTLSEDAMSKNAASLMGKTNRYFRWNLELFSIERGKCILDLGCGPGLYLQALTAYRPARYVATDYSPQYVETIKSLITDLPDSVALQIDLLNQQQLEALYAFAFDFILCLDVLEHIEQDEQVLKNIKTLLQNTGEGCLCIKVPALPFLYGENDRAIGHYRRYSMQSLKTKLLQTGYQIEKIGYQNFVGILPWFVVGKILKRSQSVSGNEGRAFDILVPVIKSIEKVFPPPIGLSLYCKCR
ncbi:MAG: class I SAM-dependent methyltransferase [Anaerolineae bacterium]|nr:class I SAM-dependent methyltransferase [Anaerolineae bacterium]